MTLLSSCIPMVSAGGFCLEEAVGEKEKMEKMEKKEEKEEEVMLF